MGTKYPKELVAASATQLVLAILARGESYGYAIIQEVHRLSSGDLTWTDGMLYPILHRLEQQDLLRSNWKQSPEGRKRKYYSLNREGKKVLARLREQWAAMNQTLEAAWEEI